MLPFGRSQVDDGDEGRSLVGLLAPVCGHDEGCPGQLCTNRARDCLDIDLGWEDSFCVGTSFFIVESLDGCVYCSA